MPMLLIRSNERMPPPEAACGKKYANTITAMIANMNLSRIVCNIIAALITESQVRPLKIKEKGRPAGSLFSFNLAMDAVLFGSAGELANKRE